VSLIEEATRALNLRAAEESKNAALEHMVAMNRERIASEACYDPRVIAFKERRKELALQPRSRISNQVSPKKLRSYHVSNTTNIISTTEGPSRS
jgi:hypothetical protein